MIQARFLASALIVLLLTCSSQLAAGGAMESIRLTRYPQKITTFFKPDALEVPQALRTKPTPLPVGGITASAAAADGALWLGTEKGLMRLDYRLPERDQRQYFAGRRYLLDDAVEQIVPDNTGGVWVRTKTGISHIELRPMTMAEKADYFEKRIHARHNRYGLVADSRLRKSGDVSTSEMMDSDNDGLWTAIYAAAECFRYSVTKSAEALANAKQAVNAVLFLEEVAGKRGFPARSFIKKGDPMPHGGEWNWTSDGNYYWKADTSSDEIVGHFFIYSIAYDLLPDKALKHRIAATTKRIMDHILQNGYTLVDLDRKPTTWGWWAPELLDKQPDEKALNSLQLLSFLKTAEHITGETRYAREYKKAATEFHYLDWLTRVNEFREELNYSDEELALLPYYCLFRYEKDHQYLQAYRKGIGEWWKNIQREESPLWTVIYLVGGNRTENGLEAAVRTLYRMPMDTINWAVQNSERKDIVWRAEADRHGHREAVTLLPPDERPVMRWNANPFVINGGDGGHSEDDGGAFLIAYWMGRYHQIFLGE